MIPIARPWLPALEDYVSLLEQIWESHMLSNFGRFCEELEVLASQELGAPALAVSSGDTGLLISLRVLDLKPGSLVGVSAFTFNSTVNAILWNGCQPVFIDIDSETFNVSPTAVAKAVTGDGLDALLATHVFGLACDASSLRDVLAGRPLVFDAAHAMGSTSPQGPIGGLGDVQAFSLSGTKVITTAEGGLVSTLDPDRLERIRLLRGYGFYGDYRSTEVGLNGKLSELHAALGLLTLPHLRAAVQRRGEIASTYRERLQDHVTFQDNRGPGRSSGKDFAIVFDRPDQRESAERRLAEQEVQTKRYFLPLHHQPAYARWARGQSLPNTESLYERSLCLPIHDSLDEDGIDRICEGIIAAVSTAQVTTEIAR